MTRNQISATERYFHSELGSNKKVQKTESDGDGVTEHWTCQFDSTSPIIPCLICHKDVLTEHAERQSTKSNAHRVAAFSIIRVTIRQHAHSYNVHS